MELPLSYHSLYSADHRRCGLECKLRQVGPEQRQKAPSGLVELGGEMEEKLGKQPEISGRVGPESERPKFGSDCPDCSSRVETYNMA